MEKIETLYRAWEILEGIQEMLNSCVLSTATRDTLVGMVRDYGFTWWELGYDDGKTLYESLPHPPQTEEEK